MPQCNIRIREDCRSNSGGLRGRACRWAAPRGVGVRYLAFGSGGGVEVPLSDVPHETRPNPGYSPGYGSTRASGLRKAVEVALKFGLVPTSAEWVGFEATFGF